MRSQRWAWTHTYAVPLFSASVVAVLLAGSAVAAVLVLRSGDGDRGGPSAECLLGTWRVVEHAEQISSGVLSGTFQLASGGQVVEYRPDGTGRIEYVEGATFTLRDSLGTTSTGHLAGTLQFEYQADETQLRYARMVSQARLTIDFLGTPLELPYELSEQPVGYRCRGDTLTHELGQRYRATYQRVGA
jgi:hypothetical protein